MAYVTEDGDIYCDQCAIGEYVGPDEDQSADYPVHCEAGAECKDAIDLTAPVFKVGDFELVGAETRKVGSLIGDLTDDGRRYVETFMAETGKTPYQRALHRLWSIEYGI